MIPRNEFELATGIPAGAPFWMPSEQEMRSAEEGIGFFRDVWPIYDVTPQEAAAVIASEQAAVRALDVLSADAEEFEHLAKVVEYFNPDGEPDPADAAEHALLEPQIDLWTLDLERLEVGVTGLAHALAAVGCVPAASCRGMHGRGSWSDVPVVFAAIDRPHAEWLLPRVESTGCTFDVSPDRWNMLLIQAPSITETMALAALILRDSKIDPPPPLRWGPAEPDDDAEPTGRADIVQHVDGQQPLFD